MSLIEWWRELTRRQRFGWVVLIVGSACFGWFAYDWIGDPFPPY